MDETALRLDNQLCFAVYAASHAFTKVYRPLLAELKITYPQYLVLLVLWEKHVATVTELCDALGLDTGTLSPLLKRLEKAGYLTRQRNRPDERQVEIRLTEEGTEKREIAYRILSSIGEAIGCRMEEIEDLVTRVQAVRRNLEKRSNHDDLCVTADARI